MTTTIRRTSGRAWNGLLLTALIFALPGAAEAAGENGVCPDTTSIDVGRTVRGARLAQGRSECFELELPDAGTLLLEVNASPWASAELRLGRFGSACARPQEREAQVQVLRTLDRMTVEIPQAGRYVFCVAAQDPRASFKDYRVTSRFVSADAVPDFELTLDEDTLQDKDDGEIDPVIVASPPDQNFGVGPSRLRGWDVRVTAPGLVVVDGELLRVGPRWGTLPSTGIETVERLVAPVLPGEERLVTLADADSTPSLRVRFFDVCAAEEDDHSELSFCASSLEVGGEAEGQITGPWGEDADVFTFVVTEPRTLLISTLGRTDTVGRLYDAQGLRLAADDDSGQDGNFLIGATLPTGRYYVRVEGALGDAGMYRLVVADLDR